MCVGWRVRLRGDLEGGGKLVERVEESEGRLRARHLGMGCGVENRGRAEMPRPGSLSRLRTGLSDPVQPLCLATAQLLSAVL